MSNRIPPTNEELLAECEVETFGSRGPGGQNVNKRETAVRVRHIPTGVTASCQNERSQLKNKEGALEFLRSKLERLFHRDRPRVPTRMPSGVRQRILNAKKIRSAHKRQRQKPDFGAE